MKKFFLIVLALILINSTFFSNSLASEEPKIISVSGNATIAVEPDRAILHIGVSSNNKKVEVAQEECNTKINAIIAALKAQGIKEEDIKTSRYSIYPLQDYNSQLIKSYQVENILLLTVHDIKTIGNIIDLAVENGANNSNNISYENTKAESLYLESLALAVQNAREKAEAIAKALGTEIDGVSTVNEQNNYPYYPTSSFKSMAYEDAGSTEILVSDLQVGANIQVSFILK